MAEGTRYVAAIHHALSYALKFQTFWFTGVYFACNHLTLKLEAVCSFAMWGNHSPNTTVSHPKTLSLQQHCCGISDGACLFTVLNLTCLYGTKIEEMWQSPTLDIPPPLHPPLHLSSLSSFIIYICTHSWVESLHSLFFLHSFLPEADANICTVGGSDIK